MTPQHQPFTVGTLECAVLLESVSPVNNEQFMGRFPNGNEADYRQAFNEMGLSFDEAISAMNILTVKIGTEQILVDAGMGKPPMSGWLFDSLALAGLTPDAITLIVITHTHSDHVLGLLNDAEEPVFPNARYVISDLELSFWRSRIEQDIPEQAPILNMMEAAGLRVINMDDVILPGLTAVPLPGHTPGQIGLLLESDGESLVHLADLLHSPMQFRNPDWSPRFDNDLSVSVPTRHKILRRVADENRLTLFYHLTFPGLGRVLDRDTTFDWQPF